MDLNCESIRAIAGLTKIVVAHRHYGFAIMASSLTNEIAQDSLSSGMVHLRVSRIGGAPLPPKFTVHPFRLERTPLLDQKSHHATV